ncbi:GNAT family N-acetyltransferase [Kitasatospora misakiensis]|uniref:GNAT family N-acetyltransferase n=1 Tax=Kitasatospora misakiensis TaxID=67330 RepID=A0ABW0X1K5_9ACTN
MTDTVALRVPATPSAPALLMRPWRAEDAPALVEVYRDRVLRRWTVSIVENEADALRWVQVQQRGRAAGDRLSFAVLEAHPDADNHAESDGDGREGRLVGNLVLKGVTPGSPVAEVGYWTAAHARGTGVAPRALEALTDWAFGPLGPEGLQRLVLLHQVDNAASCRVAEKARYPFDRVLPALPPAYPLDGHLHTRLRPEA